MAVALVAISFVSAVTTKTKTTEKKESPLYVIRNRQAIKEKIGDIVTKFFGERIFFLPLQWLRNLEELSVREQINMKPSLGTWLCGCLSYYEPYTVETCKLP
ncbi:MAG: hypothetical protein QHH19_05475 [Candidatus Thermoplasmatota archaeon]|nr:hypothetical protein [Candidatus Thermoplasmatota archaeon]